MNFQPLGSGISSKDRTPSKVSGLSMCFASVLCDLQKGVKGLRYCFLKSRRFLRKAMLRGNILLTLSGMSLVYGLGVLPSSISKEHRLQRSSVTFVVRASKPVKNLWKNGVFWLRYSFVTHSIYRKQGSEKNTMRLPLKRTSRPWTWTLNTGKKAESREQNFNFLDRTVAFTHRSLD